MAHVAKLVASIREVGLRSPISVRRLDGSFDIALITGAHRVAAFKELGITMIPAIMYPWDTDVTMDLAEIAENLHRTDNSPAQRKELLAKHDRAAAALVAARVVMAREVELASLAEAALFAEREREMAGSLRPRGQKLPKHKNNGKSMGVGRGKGGGRKPTATNSAALSEKTGIPDRTVRRMRAEAKSGPLSSPEDLERMQSPAGDVSLPDDDARAIRLPNLPKVQGKACWRAFVESGHPRGIRDRDGRWRARAGRWRGSGRQCNVAASRSSPSARVSFRSACQHKNV